MIRRAFTLMEVLLAMAIMMALLLAFFVFLRGSSTAQQAARAAAHEQLGARTLCDMIERDLICSLAGDPNGGAGIEGSATELTVLTRTVASALATEGFDDRNAFADLESVTFTFDEAGTLVSIERSVPVTVEQPAPEGEIGSAVEPETSASETISQIERLRFRYFDGENWQESFDSAAQNRLPVAVEVSLWLDPIAIDDPAEAQPAEEVVNGGLSGIDELEGPLREPTDENEVAIDVDEADLPPPDVVRLVIIPDADAGDGERSEDAASSGESGESGGAS